MTSPRSSDADISDRLHNHELLPTPNEPFMTSADPFEIKLEKAQILEQLLARVGYAVWQCAECEYTLATLVVVHLRSARGVGEDAGQKLLAAAERRTFGQALAELRKAGVLPAEVEQRALDLLAERNWVVHRAKRDHRGVLNRASELDKLVQRLDRVGEEALQVNKSLAAELEEFVVRSGVDRSHVDEEAAKVAAAWGY